MGYPTMLNHAQGLVLEERERQDASWGQQNHDPFVWLAILQEEIGEFSQEALKHRFTREPIDRVPVRQRMRDEAVQVAAVAMALVESLHRDLWTWPELSDQDIRTMKKVEEVEARKQLRPSKGDKEATDE